MVKKNLHKDKRCFIVGTGSSLDNIDLSLLKNEITIGINLILLKEDFVPNYLCVADTQVLKNHYGSVFSDKMDNGMYVLGNGCEITGRGNCTDGHGSTCKGVHIDSKYKNIYTLKHWEKSGIFIDHIDDERTKLLKTDEYYMDTEEFKRFTSYGGSTIDNLAIPLAVYLGFKEIYLLGCDGGWNHFYDSQQKDGKREWINYKHVKKELDLLGISLVNCDNSNAFKELKYKDLGEITNEIN